MIGDNIISDKYVIQRQCINCGLGYKEMDNIGRLLCRVHPGLRLCDSNNRNYYSCCGLYCSEYINCNILSSEALGCLRIDHMSNDDTKDGDYSLIDNNLTQRLDEIKSFAIKVIPSILFKYGISRPTESKCIIYDQLETLKRNDNTKLEYNFKVFKEVKSNHSKLISDHYPYNNNRSCITVLVDNEDSYSLKNKTNNDIDKIVLNIQEISTSISNSDLFITLCELEEKRIQQDTQMNIKRHSNISNVKSDGWADYNDSSSSSQQQLRHKKSLNSSFTIIKRIDDKLSINTHYSKLV